MGCGGLRSRHDGRCTSLRLLSRGTEFPAHSHGVGARRRVPGGSGQCAAGLSHHLPVSCGARGCAGEALCPGARVVPRGGAGEARGSGGGWDKGGRQRRPGRPPEPWGDELQEGLGRRAERLQRLREAKERLEREAAAAAKARQEHLLQRQAEEAAIGKKKRGRKPKGGEPGPPAEGEANKSDPDKRL